MTESAFVTALLTPDAPVPTGLVDGQGRPAGRRFAVYRNNVAGSLTEALETGFPVLVKLLGPEFFKAMAGVFLRAHPPQSRLMMHYGSAMPDFLASFPPVASLPYLPDVARLEQALRSSYHAADAPPLPTETLAQMPPDRFMAARLILAPPLRLVTSDFPVWSIWQANSTDKAPQFAMRAEAAVILRPQFDPAPHLLPAGGAAFVASLLAGKPVGTALESAGEGFNIGAMLGLLIGGGAIIKIDEDI
jgi:hypothetical protein